MNVWCYLTVIPICIFQIAIELDQLWPPGYPLYKVPDQVSRPLNSFLTVQWWLLNVFLIQTPFDFIYCNYLLPACELAFFTPSMSCDEWMLLVLCSTVYQSFSFRVNAICVFFKNYFLIPGPWRYSPKFFFFYFLSLCSYVLNAE